MLQRRVLLKKKLTLRNINLTSFKLSMPQRQCIKGSNVGCWFIVLLHILSEKKMEHTKGKRRINNPLIMFYSFH